MIYVHLKDLQCMLTSSGHKVTYHESGNDCPLEEYYRVSVLLTLQ